MPLRSKLALLLCLSASTLAAQTTIHIPADQPTIQAGIDAAHTGDTVLVSPGTYYENIDFKGKAITVTSTDGPSKTTIDGDSKTGAAVVSFISGETRSSVISNFTIRNGGTGTLDRLNLSGGVYAYNSAPTILNNVIADNDCQGVVNNDADSLIQGNTITGTRGNVIGYCLLDKGQAVLQYGSNLNLGAGIVPTLIGNIIEKNNEGNYGFASGVYLWDGDHIVIERNIFRNNIGTAIASANTNTVSILGNLIYANNGGGIDLLPPSASVGPFIGIIAGNTIANNISDARGNLYNGNTYWSGLYLTGNLAQYVVVNNIITSNQASVSAVSCDEGYTYLAITPTVFDHNDIYSGPGAAYGGSCPDQTGTYGNINADPKFSNPSADDFSLSMGSPAIDAGNNSAPLMPAVDLVGSTRIVDATGKGSPIVDMGAYEFLGIQDATTTILTLSPSTFDLFSFNPPTLTFTAALSSPAGIPSGPVTVYVDGAAAITVNVPASGSLTFNVPGLTPGIHAFVATYPGQGQFPAATSVKFYLKLPLFSPRITLDASPNPANLGTPVTLTVTSSAPDGSIPSPITLTNNGTSLATLTPDSSGQATFVTSSLAVGYHTIVAAFAGSSALSPASDSKSLQVIDPNVTTTTLSAAPNPSLLGNPVQFTATVTSAGNSAPTGTVNFAYNGNSIGSAPLNASGTATLSYSGLPVGWDLVTATYIPTGTFHPSTGSVSEQVATAIPTTTTLTCSPSTINIGGTSTFAAAASANGTIIPGTFTFTGLPSATNIDSTTGTASTAYTFPTPGLYIIRVTFTTASATYASSTATCNVTVNSYPLTITLSAAPNPATVGQTVTLSTTFAATYPPGSGGHQFTGQLSFYDGTTWLGLITPSNDDFTFSTASLAAGTHTLRAAYVDPDYGLGNTSSNGVTLIVNGLPSTATLTVAPTTAPFGTPINLIASIAAATPGTHPTPTGTVTFTVDGAALPPAPPLANGSIGIVLNSYRPGTHQLSCAYSGDATYAPSTCNTVPITIAGAPTTLTLTASPNPAYAGQSVSFTAAASPEGATFPTGAVTFLEGATALGTGTLDATGHATFSTSTLSVGTHNITASFPGDQLFLPATSSAVAEVIQPSGFTIALSPATLSLKSGTNGTALVQLGTIGSFSGPLQLTLGPPPTYATAALSASSVTLTTGATGTSTLSINTMAIAALHPHDRPGTPHRSAELLAASLTGLLSLLLLPNASSDRRRRLTRALLTLLAAVALASTTGCLNEWYTRHTVNPGAYTLPVTATDQNGTAHTANLTLTVTP